MVKLGFEGVYIIVLFLLQNVASCVGTHTGGLATGGFMWRSEAPIAAVRGGWVRIELYAYLHSREYHIK